MEYKYLFTPLKIGPVTIKNRIALGPFTPSIIANDAAAGLFNEDSIYFYRERARGGQGLIFIGETRVSKSTVFWPYVGAQLFDDRNISSLKRTVEEVHQYGAKLFIQLGEAAAHRTMEIQQNSAYGEPDVELSLVAPSQIPDVWFPGTIPKEMSIDEIHERVGDYARAAERAVEAGVDGIDIHAWGEYFIWHFLSPFFNRREDEYGGSMQNRARFLIEILQAIRKSAGDSVALGYRITTDALWPGDLTIDDVKPMVKYINSEAKVDYISCGLGGFHGAVRQGPSFMGTVEPGFEMPFNAQIKSVVDVPVFGGGAICDPHLAEEILAKGQCDVITLVRQLFTDPEFANKTLEGREDDIRNCVRCLYCTSRTAESLRVECVHNPAMGRERIWGIGTLKAAETRKKVLIIGGGPAGLETAHIARKRGHDVVLYEKKNELGGRVRLQARLPRQSEIGDITSWLERQARKTRVRIITGKEITADNLESVLTEESPDVVVIATGAVSARDGLNGYFGKAIPGWQQENVYTYEDVLDGKIGNAKKVVLFDEMSNDLSVGVAQMLAARAEEVQMVTRWATVAQDPHGSRAVGHYLHRIFSCKNIKLVPYTFVTKIKGNAVRLLFIPTQEERVEEDVDAVVLMTMFKSNNALYPLVKGRVPEVYVIGDAVSPRTIHEAIIEGHRLGRKL